MKKYITTFSLAKITVCFLVLFATFASAQTGLPGKPNDIVVNAPVSLGELKPFWRSQPVLGPYLQDGLNTTEIPNYMLQTDFPYQKRSFATEVPFADNLSVVRLLGGYSKYPGITGTLTDLTTPAGIALLDQLRAYDFVYRNAGGTLVFRPELIQQRLQPYLDLGYEDLTIVLDNIPWDLTTNTTNASLNSYGNKGVPNSSQEWYDTVSQLCTTLKTLLGEVKANKVRFRIGTEMNSLERFNGTEAQFITHYDYAAAAIQSVLPSATLSLFNISGVSLNNINNNHNVGAFRVLDHIANQVNEKTGVKLTNIPKFVSFSEYFYEGNNLTTEVSNSNDVWNYANTNIAGYQNKFSREIHEFGGLADWTAPIATANEGAFGGAMTLQVFMKYMEVGVDRIYHWNSFRTIPNGSLKYQIPTSQAWTYSVMDYLSGGAVYKIIPETPTIARNATVTSIVSVKNGKSYLLVNSFDTDKTNTQVSEVNVRIHKSYLPSNFTLASTKMASLTNTNCVLNEIRRDVELAGNLNPLLASKPDYIPSDFQDLCVDYTAFKAMVLANATKYENLWKDSLTLNSVGGNITQDGDYYAVKLNMTASQNSVVLLQGPLTTGTLTANPTTVTTFPNVNGKGNTALTMTSTNAAKVLITHQSTKGSTTTAETIVINQDLLNLSNSPVDYIEDGATHTFRLYATTAGSSVLGTLLSTVIVTGATPPTGTLTATPTTVTTFPNSNGTGNTLLTMTSTNAAKVLITHQSTNGSTTTTEDIVINNNLLSFTDVTANYIQNGRTHTFRLYATTAGSSVLGALLSTVIVTGAAPPTGTLTVNPATVTTFPNSNSTGNTLLTMTSSNAAKVLLTHQSTKGTNTTVETIVVNSTALSFTDKLVNYIQDETTHTFRLYATTAGSSVLGALLSTVIVTGKAPTTGTLTASPTTVTDYTNGLGNTTISWSTVKSPRTLITLTKTKPNGDLVNSETLVTKNNAATGSVVAGYIQSGVIFTFKLYTGVADSDVLGDLLNTVIVTGETPLVTGTLTVNPATVTTFPNANGTGNTLLTMSSSNAAKVLVTHQSTKGATTSTETIVINGSALNFTDKEINYIQDETTHTFRLYATTSGSNTLDTLLDTVIVTGNAPTTGTLTASPMTVSEYTNSDGTGNTALTMSSSKAAKVLLTHQSTRGSNTTTETIVINNNQLSFSNWPISYIQPGMVHTFRLYATEAGSSVLGALLDTVIVTGGAPSATITASGATTFCTGGSVTLTANTGTGYAYLWSPGGATTSSITTGTGGTYTVKVTNLGGATTSAPTTVTVNALPSAPASESQTFCGSGTVAGLVASGTSPKWYAAETGGSALASNIALASTNYYVSQTDAITTCESLRTPVAVTVNVTSAPAAESQTFCGSGTVAGLTTSGTAPKWYDVATSGSALASNVALASTNYYVSQTDAITGCESLRTLVAVTVNGITTQPTGALICASIGGQATLSVTSANLAATYQWEVQTKAATLTAAAVWASVVNGANYAGATSAALTITKTTTSLPKTGTLYRVKVTSSCGIETTDAVAITDQALIAAPTLSSTEAKLICKYIGTDNLVTFTADSPAVGTTAPTSYSWTVPTGAVIDGVPTGSSIRVNFKNVSSLAGLIGSVTVDSKNALGCPSGKPKVLGLTTTVPKAPKSVALSSSAPVTTLVNGSPVTTITAVKKAGNLVGTTNTLYLIVTDPSLTADHYDFTLPEGVSDVTGATSVGGSTTLYRATYTGTSTVLTFNLEGVTASNTPLAFTATSVAGCDIAVPVPSSKTLSIIRAEAGTPKGLTLTDATDATAPGVDPAVLPIVVKALGSYTGSLKTRTLTLTATPNATAGSEATSYRWELPAGVVSTTATRVGTSNVYTSNSNVISVNLSTVGSELEFIFKVFGVNGNGESLLSKSLTLKSAAPKAPAAIYAGTDTSLAGIKFVKYNNICTNSTISVPAVVGVYNTLALIGDANGVVLTHVPGSNTASIDVLNATGSKELKTFITIRATAYTATGPVYKDYKITYDLCSGGRNISDEIVAADEFSVIAYPNPSSDVFTLDVQSSSKGATGVQVYDMAGRLIENRQAKSNPVEVGRNYASGVYNVIVKQGANVKTLRVIKR